ncbi:helix-turn-helix domain-containing protein [Halocola ammonii]
MGSLADRIQEVMSEFNLTSKEFAEKIGVQRSSISHIVSGRNKPSLDFIMKLTTTFPELNSKWLLHGKEEMIKSKKEVVTDVNKGGGTSIEKGITSVTDQEERGVYERKPTPPPTDLPFRATQPTSRTQSEPIDEPEEKEKPDPRQPEVVKSGSKKLSKVILVYSDGSFEELNPSE